MKGPFHLKQWSTIDKLLEIMIMFVLMLPCCCFCFHVVVDCCLLMFCVVLWLSLLVAQKITLICVHYAEILFNLSCTPPIINRWSSYRVATSYIQILDSLDSKIKETPKLCHDSNMAKVNFWDLQFDIHKHFQSHNCPGDLLFTHWWRNRRDSCVIGNKLILT